MPWSTYLYLFVAYCALVIWLALRNFHVSCDFIQNYQPTTNNLPEEVLVEVWRPRSVYTHFTQKWCESSFCISILPFCSSAQDNIRSTCFSLLFFSLLTISVDKTRQNRHIILFLPSASFSIFVFYKFLWITHSYMSKAVKRMGEKNVRIIVEALRRIHSFVRSFNVFFLSIQKFIWQIISI